MEESNNERKEKEKTMHRKKTEGNKFGSECIFCESKSLKNIKKDNIAFQLLVKSQSLGKSLDLFEVMKFQLTPVPPCLRTADGFLNKTNKATGFNFLTKDFENDTHPEQNITLNIIDGNALFHSMTEIPDTFEGVCEKVFSL